MRVVLDANVAAAGIVFRGEAWACLGKAKTKSGAPEI